jgi:hypothetical protein
MTIARADVKRRLQPNGSNPVVLAGRAGGLIFPAALSMRQDS